MDSDSDESTKFVLLIEEHKDVLIKSRVVQESKKKEAAAAEIINKWKEVAGKTLTQTGLYKKINNFKSRAKSTKSSGKKLSEWQSKLLEIGGATDEDEEMSDPNLFVIPPDKISDGASNSETDARQLLDEHETSGTKLLSNEQLQRLVLLKQVKVLTLQQQRLERLEGFAHSESEKNIVIEIVGWEGVNSK